MSYKPITRWNTQAVTPLRTAQRNAALLTLKELITEESDAWAVVQEAKDEVEARYRTAPPTQIEHLVGYLTANIVRDALTEFIDLVNAKAATAVPHLEDE